MSTPHPHPHHSDRWRDITNDEDSDEDTLTNDELVELTNVIVNNPLLKKLADMSEEQLNLTKKLHSVLCEFIKKQENKSDSSNNSQH